MRGRTHRPLLNAGNPAEILQRLSDERSPLYAQADIIVDGSEDPPHVTTSHVVTALTNYLPPRRVAGEAFAKPLRGGDRRYLLGRAGALIAPVLPQPRCVIVTDETVAPLHLATLQNSLGQVGVSHSAVVVPPGEASKSVQTWQELIETLLAQKVDRRVRRYRA